MAFFKFPNKDDTEILEYTLNFGPWAAGDVIQAVGTNVVQDGVSAPGLLTDIVIDSVVVASDFVVAWVSGGTSGEKYTLKYTVVDNNNPVRTGVRRATIQVKDK